MEGLHWHRLPTRTKLLAVSHKVHTLELEQVRQPKGQATHEVFPAARLNPAAQVEQMVELEQETQLEIEDEHKAQVVPLR